MRYHNITHDDMLNGDGLRAVLWVAGCGHHCKGCQNPETWDLSGGIPFDNDAHEELMDVVGRDYIAGVTFSGGDPCHPDNRDDVFRLILEIKNRWSNKTVWVYTGYTYEELSDWRALPYIDVLVDGEYVEAERNVKLHWVGSGNQRIIDVQKTLSEGTVVLKE